MNNEKRTVKNYSLFTIRYSLFLLPLLFFILFYFYPLGAILKLSFAPAGALDLSAVAKIVRESYFWRVLYFTFWQATVSTLLTLALALPGAYIFARYDFPAKATLKAISTLPFVLPTVVVANAFTALLGPRGILNDWLVAAFNLPRPPIDLTHTIWIILLAHIFYNYSVALRIISGYWQNLPADLAEAAQMLGASPARAFWRVTVPLLTPAIFAAGVLVFIFSFTSFGVILILGGARFATIEVEIYRQAANLFNLPVAATLSVVQIGVTFALMTVYPRLQSRMTAPAKLESRRSVQRSVRTAKDRLIVGGNLGLMALLLATPLTALVARSFVGENGFTLAFYRELFINRRGALFFVPPGEAVINSTAIALTTVLFAVILGGIVVLMVSDSRRGWARWLDPLFMLPLATSAVTLGFGFIIALNKPPLALRSSLILVPIAHTLVAIPFVIRSVLPAVRRINPNLREAAAMLGASPGRVWREIDFPLVQRALLVGAVFAFTISMGEFGATVFIARPQTPTMPVAIFRFLGQPGALNYGQALAMSSLLMLVCTVGFVGIERFRLGDEGEF